MGHFLTQIWGHILFWKSRFVAEMIWARPPVPTFICSWLCESVLFFMSVSACLDWCQQGQWCQSRQPSESCHSCKFCFVSYLCYGSNSNHHRNVSQCCSSDKNPASHRVMTVVWVMWDLSHVIDFNISGRNYHGIDVLQNSHALSSVQYFFVSWLSHESQSISSRCGMPVMPFISIEASHSLRDLLAVMNVRYVRCVFEIRISCDSRVICVQSNCMSFRVFLSSVFSVRCQFE